MTLDHNMLLFPGKQIHIKIIRDQRFIISMCGLPSIFLNHVTSLSFTRNCDKTGFHFQALGLANEPDLLGNNAVYKLHREAHTGVCSPMDTHTQT